MTWTSLRDLPTESREGDFDHEPACPICGHTEGDMWEYRDGAETECGECGVRLTVNVDYSCYYSFSYEPPTEEDMEQHFKACCEKVQRDLRWKFARAQRLPTRSSRQSSIEGYWRAQYPTWEDYQWPEWVPQQVVTSICDFHTDSWGRGPASWICGADREQAPALGTVLTIGEDTCHEFTGRFVYCWGNMARLIDDQGRVEYCSLGRDGSLHLSCAPRDTSPMIAHCVPNTDVRRCRT